MSIEIFTDGAKNSKGSGWGVVVYYPTEDVDFVHKFSGGRSGATNNEMELAAFERGIDFILSDSIMRSEESLEPRDYIIYSDSQYSIGCFIDLKTLKGEKEDTRDLKGKRVVLKKLDGWIKGWGGKDSVLKRKNGPAIYSINEKLKKLIELKTNVTIAWVKGHSGNPGNEEADKLAVKACVL